MKEIYPQQMIDDACRIYVKYGGRKHRKIEKEMRDRGWRFPKTFLYSRKRKSGVRASWPEKYGWNELLSPEQREVLERSKRKTAVPDRAKSPGWLRAEFPEWKWGWRFQRHIYRSLERVTLGEKKRLMIFMPPRHGKSEMVTIRYAAWRLLRDTKLNVILGSYNQRLADKFSRKIRRIIENGKLITDNSKTDGSTNSQLSNINSQFRRLATASEWETAGGGVVRSVGVGGGIAGFGAGLVVIDDPVRSRADAESEVFRERVWDWFNDDIYTRLEPNAAIILIQTRWHEDDLAGRLMKEMKDGGEEWEVVCLPAIAESEIENGEWRIEN